MGCQFFKGVIQNYTDFRPKINILKGNYCIFQADIVPRQRSPFFVQARLVIAYS